jgi:hypothetical protein
MASPATTIITRTAKIHAAGPIGETSKFEIGAARQAGGKNGSGGQTNANQSQSLAHHEAEHA